jgi:hypothetical protein
MTFRWRNSIGRPRIDVEIIQTTTATWEKFKHLHYLTSELSSAAQCYVAQVEGTPVAFCAIRYQPLSSFPCWMFHRAVTLPEWQGIGIAMILFTEIARMYQQREPHRVRVTPRHPGLCRAFARHPEWRCVRAMGPSTGHCSRRGDPHDAARRGKAAASRGEITACFEFSGRDR